MQAVAMQLAQQLSWLIASPISRGDVTVEVNSRGDGLASQRYQD